MKSKESVAVAKSATTTGNMASLREALCDIVMLTMKVGHSIHGDVACGIIASKAKHALAALPRNCDVGTADEQAQRYDKFCEEMDCVKCPVRALWHHYFDICKNRKVSCGLIWAQMPYEPAKEGGEP